MNLKVILLLSVALGIAYLGYRGHLSSMYAFKSFVIGTFSTEIAENRAGTSNDKRRKKSVPEPYEEDTEIDANIFVE
ncbi:hypothetical protein [Vibrio ezurae]|uniref:Uncharacterized protein n=1 Tax=Vibrio ezurae NBRC 102218 TaxID=1219080 RepID=U3B2E5_9VIBR|nr:hypothetical protein [Vibrio ezurae]GAD79617.1 hypothetical protein VEZ01S_19_00320 [Vibrio ezurae NBRC 102218]